MTEPEGKGAVDRTLVFKPQSFAVATEIRAILNSHIKVTRDSLEFTGEDFSGYVAFQIPEADVISMDDKLTICAEMAQRSLGVKADVETWTVRILPDSTVKFQPRDFELQEEDRAELPVGRREFIDMVRPSQGWIVLIVPSVLLWICS